MTAAEFLHLVGPLPTDALVPIGWVRDQLDEAGAVAAVEQPVTDLTCEAVARALGRTASTVRGWLVSGMLRGYKLRGREWKVPPAEVERFLAAERSRPAGAPRPRSSQRQGSRMADLTAWRKVV